MSIDPRMVTPDEIAMFALAALGAFHHAYGLWVYWTATPHDDDERRVRTMGLVSSFAHLCVKGVFVIGALWLMSQPFPQPTDPTERALLYAWRGGTVLILLALDFESLYIRQMRRWLYRGNGGMGGC